MVRLASRSRCSRASTAARRRKSRLSQYSTWAKKHSVLNTGVLSLLGSEKGGEVSQPFLSTADHLVGGEGIGEFLQRLRVRTLHKSIRALRISRSRRRTASQ